MPHLTQLIHTRARARAQREGGGGEEQKETGLHNVKVMCA